MKSIAIYTRKGFTLVEMLVVIAIMAILLVLAGNVLQNAGKGRSVDSAVSQLESLIREARATAIGNDTITRLVIVNNPKSDLHLRYATVMMLAKNDRTRGKYDGTSISQQGKWVGTSAGVTFPAGVYFSPHYSKPLEWIDGNSDETMLGNGYMKVTRNSSSPVIFAEFDEKGRFVSPVSDPHNPTVAQRLVLFSGNESKSKKARDGILPKKTDKKDRPVGAKGLVIWPTGITSRLRTLDQIDDGK